MYSFDLYLNKKSYTNRKEKAHTHILLYIIWYLRYIIYFSKIWRVVLKLICRADKHTICFLSTHIKKTAFPIFTVFKRKKKRYASLFLFMMNTRRINLIYACNLGLYSARREKFRFSRIVCWIMKERETPPGVFVKLNYNWEIVNLTARLTMKAEKDCLPRSKISH